MTMFSTVLIANRGEIAVRVIRTLRSMGVRSVAVYSDADAGARHAAAADVAVRLGPAPARDSYLRIDAVIEAALATGAEAIHPGYGFLSENAAFAEACAAAAIVFIGPPVAAIEAMGDKISAKRTVAAAGVRVVPGGGVAGMSDAALIEVAAEVGFPILIKPSAGGGGKGMRRVDDASGVADALRSARREALGSFGDDTLLIERFIERPRHIEVQVLADRHGNTVHFGERECSLQRRHQKIVEEAPSPLITPELRAAMGAQAVASAEACGYVGAGTIEMIVSGDRPEDFFFLEMNTRLQVEHPVTEMVYGVDLVEWQVRIAAGESLPWAQSDIVPVGHAIEARLYAEDPAADFIPTGGTVLAMGEPSGAGVRIDSGIAAGSVIGTDYDPMLAKVIAHGPDRPTALYRLERALSRTVVAGVRTNVGFLRGLLADEEVVAGRLHTGLVGERLADLAGDGAPPTELIVAAALDRLGPSAAGAWGDRRAWRVGGPSWVTQRLQVGADRVTASLRSVAAAVGSVERWQVTIDGSEPVEIAVERTSVAAESAGGTHTADGRGRPASGDGDGTGRLGRDGTPRRIRVTGPAGPVDVLIASSGGVTHLANGHGSWPAVLDTTSVRAASGGAVVGGPVRSPMPGTVLEIRVAVGDSVTSGQAVAVIEAMKTEYTLKATGDGLVTALAVGVGDRVALDEVVLTIGSAGGTATEHDAGGSR